MNIITAKKCLLVLCSTLTYSLEILHKRQKNQVGEEDYGIFDFFSLEKQKKISKVQTQRQKFISKQFAFAY